MNPTDDDVQQMTVALFTLIDSIKRASQRSPAAGQLAVLQVIAARPEVRPSEIAAELGLNQSSITRQVRALEDAGQVEVDPDPRDRRACVITLTASGQDCLIELSQIGMARFSTFVADWDADDVRALTRLLIKLEASKTTVAKREVLPTGHRWRARTENHRRSNEGE